MQELATLASIVAALSVGVISPGPSFVMVARVAVASSRIRALATALGMGAGGAIFGAAALLGLQASCWRCRRSMQPSRSSAVYTFATWVFSYSDLLSSLSHPSPTAAKAAAGPFMRSGWASRRS
jgi:hypothetical protein